MRYVLPLLLVFGISAGYRPSHNPTCRAVGRVELNPELVISTVGDVDTLTAVRYSTCGLIQATGAVAFTASDSRVSLTPLGTRQVVVSSDVNGISYVFATAETKKDSTRFQIDTVTPIDTTSPPVVTASCDTAGATVIAAGANIQTAVNAGSTGQKFILSPGVYRMQSVTPKTNQTFCGDSAIVTGARDLSGATWTSSGSYWYVTGQTQQNSTHLMTDKCQTGFPGCYYNEELWVDGTRYQHMTSLGSVTSGSQKWFFDYTADRIYIAVNPSGHNIETSVTQTAFGGSAGGVTLKHLIVQRYTSPAQSGCVQGGPNWTVDSSEVRDCHGLGIKLTGNGAKMRWNYVHHHGQLGVAVSGSTGGLVYGNEVAYNNAAGYFGGWEAGGSKFVYTTNLIVRKNNFHHNKWNGIWPDINNTNSLIDSNIVRQNEAIGITCEISWGCTIRYNTVDTNGTGITSPYAIQRVGIICSATPDCVITGNTLHGNKGGDIVLYQQDRSTDQPDPAGRGDHVVRNAAVSNNTVYPRPGRSTAFAGITKCLPSRRHGTTALLEILGTCPPGIPRKLSCTFRGVASVR
jgi:parallel beta-helix repeat protein